MPDTTVIVRQDGTGDYTTISSAVAASNVSSGYYKIEIDDSNSYNESITFSPATGTATSSNYLWLTVSEANRHSGVAATSGHARVASGGSNNTFFINHDYGRIEYLQIDQLGTGRPVNFRANNLLMSRCIVKGTASVNGGVFVGPESTAAFIDNCLIQTCERGLYVNNSYVGAANVYVDQCTIVDSSGSANIYLYSVYGNALTTNFYNNGLAGVGSGADINLLNNDTHLIAHSGSHNAWDTDTTYFYSSTGSYTSSQDISSGGLTTTTTTANAMIVTDLTSGSENYTPVPATGAGSNLLLTNGTNRQGSEPDARQDFSTDIRGAARPTTAGKIDIGAFQITTAAGFKYWDGSAWADSTAVQYWNGSAWTDVTGIQYWNGSAWTDPS